MDDRKSAAAVAKQALATQEQAATQTEGVTLAQYLDKQKPAIMSALPRNIDVDRFTRIVLTTVRQNPRLLRCDPMSVLAATMQSAQLGLEPGSGLGEAYIIPYGNQATFQLGYRGVTKLARNSGDITSIFAEAVYEGELFHVALGSTPKITHEPNYAIEGRGTFEKMTHVYAVADLHGGGQQFAVMGKAEIEQHRNRYSKAADSNDSPWKDPLGAVEMAKKTVVLRLAKMLPLSAEVSRAFALDGSVRHELSAEMALVPDADSEKVEASALGADVIDVDENGVVEEPKKTKAQKAKEAFDAAEKEAGVTPTGDPVITDEQPWPEAGE